MNQHTKKLSEYLGNVKHAMDNPEGSSLEVKQATDPAKPVQPADKSRWQRQKPKTAPGKEKKEPDKKKPTSDFGKMLLAAIDKAGKKDGAK